MHSVERSREPGILAEIRARHRSVVELTGQERSAIRDALFHDFKGICAYCEKSCQSPTPSRKSPDEETIDHFQPLNRFPGQWLDWLNLVYSCYRCNQKKGGNWPMLGDASNNRMATLFSPHAVVTGYVNPNAVHGQRPAQDFFSFNIETGEIVASPDIDNAEWLVAQRTIEDIDLNDTGLGENDLGHLLNRRKWQRDLFRRTVDSLPDSDMRNRVILDFMELDKPFSGFVSAYVKHRFPDIFDPPTG